jgi:predicted nucleic acid-binding protein
MLIKASHFIDTSVFASVVFEDKNQQECLRYLKRVSKIYSGSTSLLALGELYLILLENINDSSDRANAFYNVNSFIEHLNLKYVTLKIPEYIQSINKVHKTDHRLDITDLKLLSEALGSNADAFITIDKKILKSSKMNKLLKIEHPRNLV